MTSPVPKLPARVDQTTFGNPGGNCFSACVASLLDLPIERVPYFMGDDDWNTAFAAWLAPLGLYAVSVQLPNDGWSPAGLYIMCGQSPRGPHAVVGTGREVLHDPHPSRAGLISIELATILVPFVAAAARDVVSAVEAEREHCILDFLETSNTAPGDHPQREVVRAGVYRVRARATAQGGARC